MAANNPNLVQLMANRERIIRCQEAILQQNRQSQNTQTGNMQSSQQPYRQPYQQAHRQQPYQQQDYQQQTYQQQPIRQQPYHHQHYRQQPYQHPGSRQQSLDNNWPDLRNQRHVSLPRPPYLLQTEHSQVLSSQQSTSRQSMAASDVMGAHNEFGADSQFSSGNQFSANNRSSTGNQLSSGNQFSAGTQFSATTEPRTAADSNDNPMSQEEAARVQQIKNEWLGCIGKSDNVAVERLPWERMSRYYPNGPPSHMGRYVPIPDDWQENNPLRLRPTAAGRGMAPEEQARYDANVDRVFYSSSRFWNMTMEEVVEDVRLRHMFAAYLAGLGLSRVEFDREYNRFVDVFDVAYAAGPYEHMTVEQLGQVPPREITEPMITMAFRNLLLQQDEAGMPEGHRTWRQRFESIPEPPVVRKPCPFGAIGEEWLREKKRREEEKKKKKKAKAARGESQEAEEDETDEDGGQDEPFTLLGSACLLEGSEPC
ncbi:hypothetical protein NKR19_g9898 [Coniochaeta hoffmannii]|uniref:Uncharacterized protein n=1 Tax=Coniochaeta hoffmannii TaxID=91930 RepID=A0AA38R874_9PEZI|nr:hypothetical protein NKR19_g9898 [Coniochaeta hoffmannii]